MIRSSRDAARIGNAINLVLGLWLAASTFVWPHYGMFRFNSLVLGLVIATLGAVSLRVPQFSCVGVLPALWLIGTSLTLHHPSAATPFHDAGIALLVIFASTTPLVAFPQPQELLHGEARS